jgi:hypothetical protein
MSISSGKSPSGDGKRRPRKKPAPHEPEIQPTGDPPEGLIGDDFLKAENLKAPKGSKAPGKTKKRPTDGESGPAASVPDQPVGNGLGLGGWIAGIALLAIGLGGLWFLNRELGRDPKIISSGKVPFSTIQCPTPQAMGRDAFLEEVRYIGHVDRELNLLEPALPALLAAAFRSHPWVAEVERVEITPGTTKQGQPLPGRVEVKMRFRVPVLRIPLEGESLPNESSEREVDALATLLPTRSDSTGVPALATRRKGVPPQPGSTWNDQVVQGGAKVAGELLKAGMLERVQGLRSIGSGWELETTKGPVFWGRTPGFESAGEPSIVEKCRRLGQWLSAPVETPPPDLSKAG